MEVDKMERRYAKLEYRADENGGLGTVSGVLMRYGDVAELPWGTEEFKPKSFEMYPRGVYANRMHERSQPLARLGRTLQLTDNDEELRVEFRLPDTSAGRDTDFEVREGLLPGLSVEFMPITDEYDREREHTTIVRAMLFGFGVVDIPAYPASTAGVRFRSWPEYRTHYRLYVPEGAQAADPEPEPALEPEPEPARASIRRFLVV